MNRRLIEGKVTQKPGDTVDQECVIVVSKIVAFWSEGKNVTGIDLGSDRRYRVNMSIADLLELISAHD